MCKRKTDKFRGRFRGFRGRGQVLLLTLLLLALVAVALAGVSRASLSRALVASDAESRLQHRWAVISCQVTLLPRAEMILERTEESAGDPAVSTRLAVTLNDQVFELLVADEQAKVNINSIYVDHGRQNAEEVVKNLVRASNNMVKIELDPLPKTSSQDSAPQLPSIGSLDQIFAQANVEDLIGTSEQPGAIQDVTCWGSGKLNFRRASTSALRQVCSGKLNRSQIEKLLDIRTEFFQESLKNHRVTENIPFQNDSNPDSPEPSEVIERSSQIELSKALEQLGLTSSQLEELDELLTDKSTCHSIWIVTRDDLRRYHWLAVAEAVTEGQVSTYNFAW